MSEIPMYPYEEEDARRSKLVHLERDALRDGLQGLLDVIKDCHDGNCPGICAADHLDAIYEAAEIARHTPGLGRAKP